MGREFGNLAKLSGITFFRLSPHEQRAFSGMEPLAVGFLKNTRRHILRIGPIFLMTYYLMNWANEENKLLYRKNPKDFENDV